MEGSIQYFSNGLLPAEVGREREGPPEVRRGDIAAGGGLTIIYQRNKEGARGGGSGGRVHSIKRRRIIGKKLCFG